VAELDQPADGQPDAAGGAAAALEISVVIPTHNRSDLLALCVESLVGQTVAPERFEVIVVDDGSSDGTVAMLAELATPFALVVLSQPQSGSSSARNLAASRARGSLLLFIDDDELADSGLVEAHLDAHRGRDATVVLGRIDRRVPEGADRWARAGVDDADWQNERLGSRPATYWDCYGGNFSCRREAFAAVGGFAVDIDRETDTEIGYRLHAAGNVFTFAPAAIVSEYRTRPWRGIVADARARGRTAVELCRRHPEMLSEMPIGGSSELSVRRGRQAVANVLLAIRFPPITLGAIGLLGPLEPVRKPYYAMLMRHAYWIGVREAGGRDLWRRTRSGTLILGYHAFGAPGERASRYVLPGRRFDRQLAWLRRRGYNVITLGEYVEYRAGHRLPPPKTLVITIDDGYLDTATVARPILERHGLSATLFLTSTDADAARQDPALHARSLLEPSAARELLGERFEIGSHTRTHPDLTTLSEADAWREIADSKLELESALGRPVTALAYPFGAANEAVRGMAQRAGYAAARGTQPGRNRPSTPSYDLRWLEIPGNYRLPQFIVTLALGELRR
jgi:glycosyltransferase involved in cell wall biosynthesis/peptidoglycan/xylan/chitin deacetylase (PgdA/CDA1 family)